MAGSELLRHTTGLEARQQRSYENGSRSRVANDEFGGGGAKSDIETRHDPALENVTGEYFDGLSNCLNLTRRPWSKRHDFRSKNGNLMDQI
jgi:hypothetical protein